MLRIPSLLLCLASTATALLNASVTGGILHQPGAPDSPINLTFSALGAAIAAIFQPLPPSGASNHTLLNSTRYSYLTLSGGAWVADVPLVLADSLILVLTDGVSVAPADTFEPWRGMIEVNGTDFAGVVSPSGPAGARFVCSDPALSPAAIWAVGSDNFFVDGLSIFGCGRTGGGAIHLQGAPMAWGPTASGATISGCSISNSSRAIWLETISGVTVDGNEIFNCSGHALDFDAFTHQSAATNNNIHHNAGREGIFIEQGACSIVVSGNTLGPGNGNGVAVFNNDMNLTTGPHFIVSNRIFDNLNAGIAVGSTAPRAGQPDVGLIIAGNQLSGNGVQRRQGFHTNGAQVGVRWAANANADGVSAFTQSATFKAANITILDPLDREVGLRY
jgi:hypothetical protein